MPYGITNDMFMLFILKTALEDSILILDRHKN